MFEVTPIDVTTYLLADMGSAFGTQVSVPENPYNTLAQQLLNKEEVLDERERAMESMMAEMERENRFILNFIMWSMAVLFISILLNFYFDHQARRNNEIFS